MIRMTLVLLKPGGGGGDTRVCGFQNSTLIKCTCSVYRFFCPIRSIYARVYIYIYIKHRILKR